MKKKIAITLILLSVLISACGEEKTSKSNQSDGGVSYTGSGDVLTDFRETQDHLNDTVARAKAMLNSLDSDGKTSDERAWKAGPGEVQVNDIDTYTDTNNQSTATSDTSQERRDATPKDIKATEGAVLLDEDGLKITYRGLEKGWSDTDARLLILIENNTPAALEFQTRNDSVNGFMVDGVMDVTVNAGMKANDDVRFDLDDAGITIDEIQNITFYFTTFSPDDWFDNRNYDMINLVF